MRKCKDCGKRIWYGSQRCKSCENRQRKCSVETKKKIRMSKLAGRNPMWKGDKIKSKVALHNWIRRRKPRPEKCVRCGIRPALDLANISGAYHRSVDDFEWLCRHCHMIEDGRISNLKQNSGDSVEVVRVKI